MKNDAQTSGIFPFYKPNTIVTQPESLPGDTTGDSFSADIFDSKSRRNNSLLSQGKMLRIVKESRKEYISYQD